MDLTLNALIQIVTLQTVNIMFHTTRVTGSEHIVSGTQSYKTQYSMFLVVLPLPKTGVS